jgi:hypothetical protein
MDTTTIPMFAKSQIASITLSALIICEPVSDFTAGYSGVFPVELSVLSLLLEAG